MLTRAEAAAVLGVSEDAGIVEVRASFRRLIRDAHPDRSGTASDETARRLIEAYRVLHATPPSPPPRREPGGEVVTMVTTSIPQMRVGVDVLRLPLPAAPALALVVAGLDRLGEISYLDRHVGLAEAIVTFVEYPPTSLVCSVQPSTEVTTTDVWCTVETLSGDPAPPIEAVVDLLIDAMLGG